MNIFISWAGPTSHALAAILKDWLPTVLPYTRPWLSTEDIRKGKPWDPELTEQLEDTSYSIVCVTTPEVAKSAWVNFEAGAISKYVAHTHVSPLLVNVSPRQMSGLPLVRFQCTAFTQTDVGRLLRSVNEAADTPLSARVINRNLRNTWRQLQAEVDDLDPTAEGDSREEDDEYDDVDRVPDFLEEFEEEVLALVAHLDPNYPTVDELFTHMQENRTRLRHYIDCLVGYGLLYCQEYTEGESD